jgi:hypothetical protein
VKDSSLCDHHFERKSIRHWYVIFGESNAQSFGSLIATFRPSKGEVEIDPPQQFEQSEQSEQPEQQYEGLDDDKD